VTLKHPTTQWRTADELSARIAELGPFELLTHGDELPVFAFTVSDNVENYTVFDVSNALRERGWQVPAYTFPENRTDLAALRVVVRRGSLTTWPTC
jgi:glutamate decarboxylase